jgi:hypothetical protein
MFVPDAQCDVRAGRCVVPTATPTRTHTRTPVPRPPERGCCEQLTTEILPLCLTGVPREGCRGVFVPGGTCNEQGRCVTPTTTPTVTGTPTAR